MSAKRIAMVSGAVLLALTATVSAGPMNVTQSKLIAAPQAQTEPVYYRYYHHRHYAGIITDTMVGTQALQSRTPPLGWRFLSR